MQLIIWGGIRKVVGGDTSIWFLYDTNGEYGAVIKDDGIAELLSSSSVRFMYSIRVAIAFVFLCMNYSFCDRSFSLNGLPKKTSRNDGRWISYEEY